jgi:hypothetical protein
MKLDITTILMLLGGSALGTLVKSVLRPEPHFGRWLLQAFIAMAIGIVAGGAVIEYFRLDGFQAAAAGAAFALISEEVVRGLQARGRRVARGDFSGGPAEGGNE